MINASCDQSKTPIAGSSFPLVQRLAKLLNKLSGRVLGRQTDSQTAMCVHLL